MPLAEVQKVGILFEVEDLKKHEAIKQFAHQLEMEGKKVQVLSFLGKGKENFEFKYDFFTEKEVSFWGQFKDDNIIKFQNSPFDYLFNFDVEPNLFIKKILANSQATCRVGRHLPENEMYFEWMIAHKKGYPWHDFTNNTLKYLRLIRN